MQYGLSMFIAFYSFISYTLFTGTAMPSIYERSLIMRKPRNESKLKQKVRRAFLTNPLFIYKTANGKILTRDATRILVCLLRDIDDMVYWGYDIKKYFIDSYLKDVMTDVEIFSALKYLEELHLIENLSGTPENYIFNPTHEGMHFLNYAGKILFIF